jgi:predicted P-loop ATPase
MNEPARLHNSWVIELPEIDYQFKTKNIEPFKNLITTRVDETRKPYARDPEKLYRRFVFIGTTNVNGLLVDSTGNRRFVPLEIGVEKDTDTDDYRHRSDFIVPWQRLRKERDSLWAAAIRDFRAGEPYEFTSEEIEIISAYQKQFADPDPWEDAVVAFIANKPDVAVVDILKNALDYGDKKDKITRRESKRIVDILQSLGWRKLKTNRKNKKTGEMESLRLWKRPENEPIDERHINYDF